MGNKPNSKTRKAVAKRFKVTASGKVKHQPKNKRHILTKKSKKRKRQLRGTTVLSKADTPRIREMLKA